MKQAEASTAALGPLTATRTPVSSGPEMKQISITTVSSANAVVRIESSGISAAQIARIEPDNGGVAAPPIAATAANTAVRRMALRRDDEHNQHHRVERRGRQ